MNTSYEKLSFYNSFFGGMIEDDNILTTDMYGNKTVVGVTMKKHQETLDLLNTYYNKLVELGVIEKEKTPEEVAKEQQEMMKAMMIQMQAMQEKIDSFGKTDSIKGYDNESKPNSKYREQAETKSEPTEFTKSIDRKGKSYPKFDRESKGSTAESEH